MQPDYSITIDDTQATRQDLSDFVLALLKANGCGSYTTYENGNITWYSIEGVDRSNSIVFSQSMDNLISSEYYQNSENKKTFCRVVSKFSQNNQDVEYAQDYNQGATNIDRLEMVVESNLSTKLEDGTEISPSSATYKTMQQQEGKNQLAEKYVEVQFNAEIDLQYSNYEFEKDFFIGDWVKVRDEYFNYEADVRILKYTFKQDATGYGEEAEYGTE